MDKNQSMKVYGINLKTGEYKLVFSNINITDWFKRGEQNAKNNNYAYFRFFSTGNLQDHYTEKEIFITE